MDRSLDDIVAERQRADPRPSRRGPPAPRRSNYNSYPRDGVRKPTKDDRPNLDNDWTHDRFDDEPMRGGRARSNSRRHEDVDRRSPEQNRAPPPAKLRVDNLHYDLTEDDIYDLFTRIAPVVHAQLRYDRAGRSEGLAFVTYAAVADARTAIREFDGANAKGQPIRLTLMPIGPSANGRSAPAPVSSRRDNPFDRVENPKSLFDRIEAPGGGRGRRRSESPLADVSGDDRSDSRRRGPRRGHAAPPPRDRRSDMTKPPPENIDRYVPGQSSARSPRRNGASGRRPGERRERDGRERREPGPRPASGRPRKTHEELDAEMEDYWGAMGGAGKGPGIETATTQVKAAPALTSSVAPAATELDDDIDMIE